MLWIDCLKLEITRGRWNSTPKRGSVYIVSPRDGDLSFPQLVCLSVCYCPLPRIESMTGVFITICMAGMLCSCHASIEPNMTGYRLKKKKKYIHFIISVLILNHQWETFKMHSRNVIDLKNITTNKELNLKMKWDSRWAPKSG